MASREPNAGELAGLAQAGVGVERVIAAYDSTAILVHRSNPVSDLTARQIESVFAGEITDWAALGGAAGPIQVYTKNVSSASYAEFKMKAMKGRDYAKGSIRLSGSDLPYQRVAEDPQGIVFAGHVYGREAGVKALTIDGIPAENPASVYRRALFYYIRSDCSADVRAFVKWSVESPEAIRLISSAGFFPPNCGAAEMGRDKATRPTPAAMADSSQAP